MADRAAGRRRACGRRPDDTEVLRGRTVELLAAHAAGARMLVLGSYGDGARSGMLAGSVALALIGRAVGPVAVVRGPAPQVPPPRNGPVVVGVDGSPAGHSALMFGAALVSAIGARLVIVHTFSDVVPGPHGEARRRPQIPMILAAEGAGALDAELDLVSAAYPALPVERDLVGDTPLRALMGRAKGARLLVVGFRGHREETGMLLGSTSRAHVAARRRGERGHFVRAPRAG